MLCVSVTDHLLGSSWPGSSYHSDLLRLVTPSRVLRFADQFFLGVPRSRHKTRGIEPFLYQPQDWGMPFTSTSEQPRTSRLSSSSLKCTYFPRIWLCLVLPLLIFFSIYLFTFNYPMFLAICTFILSISSHVYALKFSPAVCRCDI